jgi:multidrug transporter EmrE-like cation transporter
MAWMFLLVAGLLEIVWASMMKRSQASRASSPRR